MVEFTLCKINSCKNLMRGGGKNTSLIILCIADEFNYFCIYILTLAYSSNIESYVRMLGS